MIAIIDYDAGNIKSVEKALRFLGEDVCLSRDPAVLRGADRVILPGVGNFGDAAGNLRRYQLEEVIREIIARGTPFLGICVGLQLLFEGSDESPEVPGLSILGGRIRRLPEGDGRKIPHMGWNSLTLTGRGRLFEGIPDGSCVYFVHSYYLDAADKSIVRAQTRYGAVIDASVESGNLFATQFHPEKSGECGLRILKNFCTFTP